MVLLAATGGALHILRWARGQWVCCSGFLADPWLDWLHTLTHRSPAASRIRAKILYATSKQGLRRLLDGVHYEVQATDPSEMGFDVIRGRAQ